MIILNDTDQSFVIELDGAVTTTELDWIVFYDDTLSGRNAEALLQLNEEGTTSGASEVEIIAAPVELGRIKRLTGLTVCNKDTADATVTISKKVAGVKYAVFSQCIGVNYTIQYNEDEGWDIL